jgi:hypothetical protein
MQYRVAIALAAALAASFLALPADIAYLAGDWPLRAYKTNPHIGVTGSAPSGGTSQGKTTGQTIGRGTGGGATCSYGNHGAVRGWAHVANGTLVADDGCLIRAAFTHTINAPRFSDYFNDVNWWRELHDVGHFNGERVAGFLGGWFRTGNSMDLPTLVRILDTIVANASDTGMYVIIDDHSSEGFNSPTNWDLNTEFWQAIAPRYANNSNVIYEIKNEPDTGDDYPYLATKENAQYQLIRSRAPSTPIIVWSFESILRVDKAHGLLNTLSEGNQIDYSNAVVGYHPYEALGQQQRLDDLTTKLQNAGYPLIMTEYSNDHTPPWPYLLTVDSQGISWFLLWGSGSSISDTMNSISHHAERSEPSWPAD